jgi:hypothetical protein
MDDFTPIDHMDSDTVYRTAVREGVETLLGSKLRSLDSPDTLIGDWDRSFPRRPDGEPQRFTYLSDGTFRSRYDSADSPPGKWEVRNGTYMETTWCKPMPEYGIDDGTWNPETYHCAATDTGAVALWNGDGSMLLLLTKRFG